MAKISPFRAIRPVRDKVHLVATRPYYTYKKNVLQAKLEDNPFTFLHIINPEFGIADKTAPNSVERFMHVKESYESFIDQNILIQDESPAIYLYRQTVDGHEYTGIVCGASIDEYNNNKIKKHEATISSRETMFTDYLDIVGYNAEPVLLSYSGDEKIENLINSKTKQRPEFEFTTTDLKKHDLWILDTEESSQIIELFESVDDLYIADGHHRSASSAKLEELRKTKNSTCKNENAFLSLLIDEKKLDIIEFNRLSKTLNGLSVEEFLEKMADVFEIKKIESEEKPEKVHEFSMYLNNEWYKLNLISDSIDYDHPVNCLDAQILTDFVLDPILGITDLKDDSNIDFWPGSIPLSKVEKAIDKGKFKVGFILHPVSMDEVKKVADNELIMPPKSTWVEPKLRSGLTIYKINE